ncbi:MAG TPA: hypothetical protein VER03_13500 [Bryobacteraceae bacterium]|nr:hypothetical protein [Bryobacteraceae bacterium]
MSPSIALPVFAAFALLLPAAPDRSRTTADVTATSEFGARLERYLELRKEALKSAPAIRKNAEPENVLAREKALAAMIRKARVNARAGEIFTPAARKHFRAVTMAEVHDRGGAPVKETIKLGNPPADPEGADVKLQVNGAYPKAAPKSTMPPSVLHRFPKLPPELEYRFVGRALILLDTAANLIVDYAPEVGPAL